MERWRMPDSSSFGASSSLTQIVSCPERKSLPFSEGMPVAATFSALSSAKTQPLRSWPSETGTSLTRRR